LRTSKRRSIGVIADEIAVVGTPEAGHIEGFHGHGAGVDIAGHEGVQDGA
jgi:hypothetical protein